MISPAPLMWAEGAADRLVLGQPRAGTFSPTAAVASRGIALTPPPSGILSAREAAALIGRSVSWLRLHDEELRPLRPAGCARRVYLKDHVDAYLAARASSMTTAEAAARIGVHRTALRRYDAALQPRIERQTQSSHRIYDRAIVEQFAAVRAAWLLAGRRNAPGSLPHEAA